MGIRGLLEFSRQYTDYYRTHEISQNLPPDNDLVTVDGNHLINVSLVKQRFSPNDKKNLDMREILGKLLVLRRSFPMVLVVFDGQKSHPIKERYSRIKAFYGLTFEQKCYYVDKFVQDHPSCDKTNVLRDHLDELAFLHDQERSHVRRFNHKIMRFVMDIFLEIGISFYVAESEADFVMAKLNSISILSSGDSDMIFLCDYIILKILPPKKNGKICLTTDCDNEGGIVFLDKKKMLSRMIQSKMCTQEQYEQACYLSNTEVNLTWTCKCNRKACSCRPDFNNMLTLLSRYGSSTKILKERCQFPKGFTPASVEKDIRDYYTVENHQEVITSQYVNLKFGGYSKILSFIFTEDEKKDLYQNAKYWYITQEEADSVFYELYGSYEHQKSLPIFLEINTH